MQFDWAGGDVIVVDGTEVASADRAWFRERAEVQIGPERWLYRANGSWLRTPLVAELDGVERFRADPSGVLSVTWTVECGSDPLQLTHAGIFTSRLHVTRAGTVIGEATRSGLFTTRARLDLSEAVDLRVGCFLLWVAHVEFNRNQSGSGAVVT